MPNPDQDKWLAKIGVPSALKRAKGPPTKAPQTITFSEDEVSPITVSRVATKTTSPEVIAFSENEVPPIITSRPVAASSAKSDAPGGSPNEEAEGGSGFVPALAKEAGLAAVHAVGEIGGEHLVEYAGEALKDGAGKIAEAGKVVGEGMELVGKAASVAGAAMEGWEIGEGVNEVLEGKTAEGATKIVGGSAGLGVKVAEVTAAAGTAGAGAAAAAGLAAGGSVLLAKETAEAAIKGEETPIDVADKFYGTHFGDIAGWVKGDYSKDKKKA